MAKDVLINHNCNTIVTLCNNFIQLLMYVVKKNGYTLFINGIFQKKVIFGAAYDDYEK